ncbi:lipid binding protein [Cantharellus anzutake]|uniref:lipid binding protein n=1 Tax=Cantharellus anzutake TaxID=1750568 RepID=UPI001904D9A3|nr:lipid binding protein [Cantharellus anzutake]KAF8320548.1 lipid binding protein [Cantharellus anzutake]
MESEIFDSVTWDTPSDGGFGGHDLHGDHIPETSTGPGYLQASDPRQAPPVEGEPKWEGYLDVELKDPVKELDGTKDAYISYLVCASTNLITFSSPKPSARRRFQDFVFLHENLVRDFPACVVPPLPGKHRLEYITGDRFSPEFVEHRRVELERFLVRIARHPILQRATLVRSFFESTDWTVKMHQHLAHPPGPDPVPSLLDNISDTLLNAFSRVRKPDERFLEVREGIDKFDEGLNSIDRLWNRSRSRTDDLSNDYHDLALSIQGLGFLESGITEHLNAFSNTLLEFSAILKNNTVNNTDPFLTHLHSLLAYSQAHRGVLRLRDQKQLDLEELTQYLSNVVIERDRLSSLIAGRPGTTSQGIGAYLRERVDAIRGADDDRSRVEKMRKLDTKITELQDAVTTASETSEAFSSETLKEYTVFQHAKRAEMKDLFDAVADGQIDTYRKAMEEWEKIIPVMQRIRLMFNVFLFFC